MKVCLHQVFKIKSPKIKVEGVGDCSICISDEKNKLCKKYCPITIQEFIVYENK